jgi:hypothetical protein
MVAKIGKNAYYLDGRRGERCSISSSFRRFEKRKREGAESRKDRG